MVIKTLEHALAIPGNDPSVEFNVVHTTGIGPEVVEWLTKTFGPTREKRWFIVGRAIYFRYERDWIWFELTWS